MISAALLLILSSAFFTLRLGSTGSFPRPLSAAEERECLERAAQGDEAARNRLVEHNLRLVAHIIKKYYTASCDQDDLISIGTIGLIKGVSSFNAGKGVRLATYASRCIENEILMYFRRLRKTAGDLPPSETLDTEEDSGSLSLMDVICVEDDMFEALSLKENCRKLRGVMEKTLSERENEIVTMRYGLGGTKPMTQREAAKLCGISRSYVSRIEKRALEKLRAALE
ncbi:MAG: RNA polymerase sporulation sigma factor SigK, partial [Oscillospiraceae bacterium]|nr:RNA polymerase sporulation sigma factor SigK [Oscillospiraceae bacterium]